MIRFRLFGRVSLEGPTGVLTGRCAQPRQLAVLARLAVAPGGSLTRDKLIGCFWPEEPEATARHRLRDVIYLLRRDLGDETIVSAGELLRIDSTTLHTDVDDFRRALDEGDLRRAVELYSGPFLDGFYLPESRRFEEWLDSERRDLARRHGRALEMLAERASESGDARQAVEWWEKRGAQDPLDSRIALKLMAAYAACGSPAAALRHGRAHQNRLRVELDIEPDPKVRAFIQRLQDGAAEQPAAGEERGPRRPPKTTGPSSEDRSESGGAHVVEDALPLTETGSDSVRARKGVASLLLAGLILAAGLFVVTLGGGSLDEDVMAGTSRAAPERSVAVLPFEDLSREDQDYFVRGMHEAVLTSLASLEDLVVTSPGAVLPAEITTRAPGAIAKELGVSHLLLGSVQRAGDRIRVTARLVDAGTGRQLWAERFERPFTAEAVFEVQSSVARATASALEVSLSPEEEDRLARRPTGEIEAYDYYLRGHERLGFVEGEPVVDRGAVEQAIGLFNGALELDPKFALAHVGLARSYMELSEMEGGPWGDSVGVAAGRALDLDPELPEAHLALAWSYRYRRGPEDRATYAKAIRRVLELRPSAPRAALEVAWWWSPRDMVRLDQIACWAQRAARLDPSSPELLRVMGLFFWTLGDHESAQRAADAALKLEPDAIHIYELLVRIALSRGDRAGAIAYYEMARSVASSSDPDVAALGMMETYLGMLDSARVHLDAVSGRLKRSFPEKVTALAYALWETGYRERAMPILEWREARNRRLLENGSRGPWPAFNLAKVLAVRGEEEAAVDAMEEAVARGVLNENRIVPAIDGPLRKLWGHARFDSLMSEARWQAARLRGRIEREGCDAIRELPEPEDRSVR